MALHAMEDLRDVDAALQAIFALVHAAGHPDAEFLVAPPEAPGAHLDGDGWQICLIDWTGDDEIAPDAPHKCLDYYVLFVSETVASFTLALADLHQKVVDAEGHPRARMPTVPV